MERRHGPEPALLVRRLKQLEGLSLAERSKRIERSSTSYTLFARRMRSAPQVIRAVGRDLELVVNDMRRRSNLRRGPPNAASCPRARTRKAS